MPESEKDRRQQALAMLRARAHAKREGKKPIVEESNDGDSEAPPPMEESEKRSEDEQGPLKKAKFNANRDSSKKPTEDELVEHLRLGVSWPPTRFVDKVILKELEIEEDIQAML